MEEIEGLLVHFAHFSDGAALAAAGEMLVELLEEVEAFAEADAAEVFIEGESFDAHGEALGVALHEGGVPFGAHEATVLAGPDDVAVVVEFVREDDGGEGGRGKGGRRCGWRRGRGGMG